MLRAQMLVLVAALALSAAVSNACSGDEGLSGQEYFARLQERDDASEKSQDDLVATYDAQIAVIAGSAFTDDRIRAETTFYEGLVQIGKDYVNAIDDLKPPKDVRDAHEAYVSAYDEVLIQLNAVVDDIAGVTTVGGLNALLSNEDITAAYDRANKACADLQASAASVDAQVDLECQT